MLNVEIDDECFKMYDKMKRRELKIINFKLSPDNKVIHVDHNCIKYRVYVINRKDYITRYSEATVCQ